MEKEKRKPHFFIKAPIEPTGEIDLNVNVYGHVFTRKAKFYIVAIGNSGLETAENFEPLIGIEKAWRNAQPLLPSAPSKGRPVSVDWIRPLDEFDNSPRGFARALVLNILHKITQQPALVHNRLGGGGAGGFFQLFLTIEGSKTVFFIGEGEPTFESEEPFEIELRVQAKDIPLVSIAFFAVKVTDWNDVSVTMRYASEEFKPPDTSATS